MTCMWGLWESHTATHKTAPRVASGGFNALPHIPWDPHTHTASLVTFSKELP